MFARFHGCRLTVFLAAVLLVVTTHAASSQSRDTASLGPFDLVVKTPMPGQLDLNGFLLNPQWQTDESIPRVDPSIECGIFAFEGVRGFRSLLLRDPDCFGDQQLSLLRLSEPRELVVHGLACNQPLRDGSPGGHLNWFPATFTGVLQYNGLGNALGGDYDFTFELYPDGPSPSTRWNDRKIVRRVDTLTSAGSPARADTVVDTLFALHTEFDYRETTSRLVNTTSQWWSKLDTLSENDSRATRRAVDSLLGEGRVIVTGLFNLDLVHHGHAEVHPVYAMALLEEIEQRTVNEVRHHWKLLVRDRGNEGNCSSESQIVFQTINPRDTTMNRYRFTLEEPEGAGGTPRIIEAESWIGSAGLMHDPEFSWVPGEGLVVTTTWPRPTQHSRDAVLLAEITVAWPGVFDRPLVAGRTRSAMKMVDNALGNQTQMNLASAIRRMELPDFQPERRRHAQGKNEYKEIYYDSLEAITDLDLPFDLDTLLGLEPATPVYLRPPLSFELQPPLYVCDNENTQWLQAPRCVSDWSLGAHVGARVRSPWTTVGLTIQHARLYLGLPTIPLRFDAEVAWRVASSDSTLSEPVTASQTVDLRLSALAHVVPLLHDAWFILTAGPGLKHETSWEFSPSFGGGLGIPVRNQGPRITLEGKALSRKWFDKPWDWAFYATLHLRIF